MALQATEVDCIAIPRQPLQGRAQYIAPEAGKSEFSMALVSGSGDATSEMVFPNPLEHCVVSMVGILRI